MRFLTTAFFVAYTLGVYWAARALCRRVVHPLMNVVVLAAGIIIATLAVCGLPFSAYAPAKDVVTFFLGPATVGLAVPLYRNRYLLKCYARGIGIGVAAGSLVAMVSVVGIALLGGLPKEVVLSLIPKGVTMPFAVETARMTGGVPALTTAFVIATGTLGAVLGPALLTRSLILDPVARGLALGTVSHGMGTATALMEGEEQGAMSGLAMTLAGIVTAALAPVVAMWI